MARWLIPLYERIDVMLMLCRNFDLLQRFRLSVALEYLGSDDRLESQKKFDDICDETICVEYKHRCFLQADEFVCEQLKLVKAGPPDGCMFERKDIKNLDILHLMLRQLHEVTTQHIIGCDKIQNGIFIQILCITVLEEAAAVEEGVDAVLRARLGIALRFAHVAQRFDAEAP
ncbi:hypothetical protein N7468_010682 [Penicillium chermesinum]|uniref:Uncharacterized protein n=1 Tax=Penicillium chermesinum TaxID=63820 RepID=A0A9W9N9M9_9EURO|nr:uncharacterized protein N7468_010682 [Penicillium chermesinum]KAJ5215003.1 hypothetical protein N7468_010682 [Penicillium chermesinum]